MPVPAWTSRCSPPTIASATASAISIWPVRSSPPSASTARASVAATEVRSVSGAAGADTCKTLRRSADLSLPPSPAAYCRAMAAGYREVQTRDGRTLEVLTGGDPEGFPLLFHGGSPSAVVHYAPLDDAAREAGLRLVSYSRPGYGGSTARPRLEPRMIDDVADSVTILDTLDVERFVTAGWSGGGPRALGCAALLPERCLAAACIAGVGPHDAEGLDWKAGMAPENVAEYTAAEAGRAAYEAFLEEEFLPVLMADADDMAEAMGGLLPPADQAALDRGFTEWLTETFHRAGVQRVAGVLDDGQAAVRPWGFDVGAITVPVAIYQGRQDAMVPYAHGEWLAAHVPNAEVHLTEDDGHLTLVTRLPEILADLKRLAGV